MLNNIFNFCDCCNAICTFKRKGLIQSSGFLLLVFLLILLSVNPSSCTPGSVLSMGDGGKKGARVGGWGRGSQVEQGLQVCKKVPKEITVLLQWHDTFLVENLRFIDHVSLPQTSRAGYKSYHCCRCCISECFQEQEELWLGLRVLCGESIILQWYQLGENWICRFSVVWDRSPFYVVWQIF